MAEGYFSQICHKFPPLHGITLHKAVNFHGHCHENTKSYNA